MKKGKRLYLGEYYYRFGEKTMFFGIRKRIYAEELTMLKDYLLEIKKYFGVVAGFFTSPHFGTGLILISVVLMPPVLIIVLPCTGVLYLEHLRKKEEDKNHGDTPSD